MLLSLISIKLTSHLLFDNVCIIFLKSSEIPLKIPKCPSSDCLKYLYPDIIDDICKKKRHIFITLKIDCDTNKVARFKSLKLCLKTISSSWHICTVGFLMSQRKELPRKILQIFYGNFQEYSINKYSEIPNKIYSLFLGSFSTNNVFNVFA